MNEKNINAAEAQMQIRKPAEEVFEAFVDPELTKHFWFTKGSGRMELDQPVTWTWEMYNFSTKAVAKEMVPGKRLVFDWYMEEAPSKVEVEFQSLSDGSTYVRITHSNLNKSGDELTAVIKDSTEGFAFVLAGLKAYLEHGIDLNLVRDKFPKDLGRF